MRLNNPDQKVLIATILVSSKNGELPESYSVIQEIQLYTGESLRIGRSQSNDLVLADSKISRFHAILSASENGIVLSDLSSTNGTFLGEKRMTAPVDLANGDIILLGGFRLEVRLARSHSGLEEDSSRTALSQMLSSELTVLLIDVCSYTTITQGLPEQDVAEMLRTWLNFSSSLIISNDGVVDKYVGDCVMALWKSDTISQEELAKKAVQTAAEVVQRTREESIFREWKHGKQFPWLCRAVVHSGTALMGSLGGSGRANYSALGDTVNVAFRIEHLADRFTENLIVSENTARLIPNLLPLNNLGTYTLEGRSGAIEIFGASV